VNSILNGIKTDDLSISVSGAGNLKVNDLVAKNFSVDLSAPAICLPPAKRMISG